MEFPGVFTISLDFELHWGCFETMSLDDQQQQYFRNTIDVIPQMLKLFSEKNVHVTWATVGMLFMRNKSEWMHNKPALVPSFDNPKVSAYNWIEEHGFYSEEDPFHFAPQLIQQIQSAPHQELATHTYAHYFCLEKGQTPQQFKTDIEKACAVAKANGTTIRSLVFPRNQFNPEYLSICADAGITSIRSSPDIWYWSPATGSTFMKKFFRAGDAYLKFQPIKMVYLKDIAVNKQLPLCLPASRLYRPWKSGQPLQNKLKMRRILNEMTEAARKKAYYHLWWHPHNFGNNPRECMDELQQIVENYCQLRNKYGFESLTMEETTQLILRNG
jgi:peptidoglycan/xylan/chitin deacetylase (PgdA/CDA1 family)